MCIHLHRYCMVDVVGACPFRGTFNFNVTMKQQSNSIICYGGMKNNKYFKKKMTPFFLKKHGCWMLAINHLN